MSEQSDIQKLCVQLGAPVEQAEAMARQLVKRAEQLAVERKISPAQALEYLLRILVQGRQGQMPPEFRPAPPSLPE